MKEEFQDFIAISEERNHCFVNLEKDCIEKYVLWCSVNLYGVPTDLSEEKESDIYDGNFDNAVNIGTLKGCLILCKNILENGESPYDICDDLNGDLEMAMSILQANGGLLNNEYGDEYQDVFYIDELILNNVSNIVFSLYHVEPNILCYYPQPIPYEENINKKIKREMAVIVARDILEKEDKNNNSDYNLVLDEEQLNCILGRHNPSDAYPEEAKDKPLWSIYQKSGFVEVGNSRLLHKLIML